jgi:hypothetical protein
MVSLKSIVFSLFMPLLLLSHDRPNTPVPIKPASPQSVSKNASQNRLISESSVGPVRLGMRVSAARKALPGFKFSRTRDGDGVALIAVEHNGRTMMTLYAGEPNPEAAIKERAVIEFIEAWDESYRTAAGVHPKMPLREVEQKYGKFKEIMVSEIEQREYATFARQPAGITLRVMNENGSGGIYAAGQNKATSYADGAYILSISISGLPPKGSRL